MTTEQLIREIERRITRGRAQYETDRAAYDRWYPAQDPACRAIEARSFAQASPPLSAAELVEGEARLGFALPPLLRQLYTRVGDGGFGPAYGMYGLLHAHPTQ